MATHELKCWPTPFAAIKRGDKTFEVRKDDRGYAVGDTLILKEFEPQSEYYSGEALTREVAYILKATPDEFFGVKDGYVVMSIR